MIQSLKSFSVRSLTVKGFKGFADETTFSFGDMNTITGHNGQGKTSIADAIAFAVTVVPFYGGAKLDHLYYQNARDILVDMEFTDEAGAVRRLTRQRVNDNMDKQRDKMAFAFYTAARKEIEEYEERATHLIHLYLQKVRHGDDQGGK